MSSLGFSVKCRMHSAPGESPKANRLTLEFLMFSFPGSRFYCTDCPVFNTCHNKGFSEYEYFQHKSLKGVADDTRLRQYNWAGLNNVLTNTLLNLFIIISFHYEQSTELNITGWSTSLPALASIWLSLVQETVGLWLLMREHIESEKLHCCWI